MKIFHKRISGNGRIRFYLFGIKIASYKSKKTDIHNNTVIDPIEHARSLGVKIGKNVRLIVHPHPWSLPDFGSEPYLISIGDETCISFGCTFLTHDASIHVCEKFDKKCPKLIKFGKVSIGKNCFIGCRSIIMPGVSIGNNCVVGAGSIVTKSIPSGEVWAGNPAHFIMNIKDYTKKCIKANKDKNNLNAYKIVCEHRGKNG